MNGLPSGTLAATPKDLQSQLKEPGLERERPWNDFGIVVCCVLVFFLRVSRVLQGFCGDVYCFSFCFQGFLGF